MIKRLFPGWIKRKFRQYFPAWRGSAFQCPVCNSGLAYYNPFPQEYYDNWKKFGFELGDNQETLFTSRYQCPACRCADRDRLAALTALDWLKGKSDVRMLEVAPLECTMNFFKSQPEISDYQSADITSPIAVHKVDITDLHATFKDASFDLIYCSHVLEHVPDDIKAMKELYRILAPGGIAIFFVPIFNSIQHIDEDVQTKSDAERWRRFGQNDHVRIYHSSGFMDRLSKSGFSVDKKPATFFPVDNLMKSGVSESSFIYLGNKIRR